VNNFSRQSRPKNAKKLRGKGRAPAEKPNSRKGEVIREIREIRGQKTPRLSVCILTANVVYCGG
jgi:hypothetical protein